MERGRKEKKEVLEQMRRIVRSRPNDAVKLAFLDKEQIEEIDRMDLFLLSELKRSGNGGVEGKLSDPLQTMERLLAVLREGETSPAESFYQALESGAGGNDAV